MEVYRITLTKYADKLFAPGLAGRWNQKGQFVIYTASSRSLACLENVVHRRGTGLHKSYKVMVIHIPDSLSIRRIEIDELPKDWASQPNSSACQKMGSAWYQEARSCLLSVPSAVVAAERNLVIHAKHPDFAKIQLIDSEPFVFDPRLVAT